jgi:hypothetical protein
MCPFKLSFSCAGLTISNLAGTSGMWINYGATVTLKRCTFIGNSKKSPSKSVLSVSANDPTSFTPDPRLQDTIVRLQQCNFVNNTAEYLIATSGGEGAAAELSAVVYSDEFYEVRHVLRDGTDKVQGTEPLAAAPADRQGLSDTSFWIQNVKKVRSCCAYVCCEKKKEEKRSRLKRAT